MALAFGIPYFELLDRLPAYELSFWEAFEQVEGPIGYARQDILAAFGGYMSTRIKPRAKPKDAVNLIRWFVEQLLEPPTDQRTATERQDDLTSKIFSIFGNPFEASENGANQAKQTEPDK